MLRQTCKYSNIQFQYPKVAAWHRTSDRILQFMTPTKKSQDVRTAQSISGISFTGEVERTTRARGLQDRKS